MARIDYNSITKIDTLRKISSDQHLTDIYIPNLKNSLPLGLNLRYVIM